MIPEPSAPKPLRTLEDAIGMWNMKNPQRELKVKGCLSVADLKTAGFGKTFFASFDSNSGWKIRELGWGNRFFAWIARAVRSCGIGYQNTVLTKKQKLELLVALVDRSAVSSTVLGDLVNVQGLFDTAQHSYLELSEQARVLRTVSFEQFVAVQKQAGAKLKEREVYEKEAYELVKDNATIQPFVDWLKLKRTMPSAPLPNPEPELVG